MINPPKEGPIPLFSGEIQGDVEHEYLSHDLRIAHVLVIQWKHRVLIMVTFWAQVPFPCSSLGPGCLPLGIQNTEWINGFRGP